jgi:hypothetical protein
MSEKEYDDNQDTTECDKSNTNCDSKDIISNLEENMAQVTISSSASNLEDDDVPFTLSSQNFPVINLEESDTPVTIGGWDFQMNNLNENNGLTPFNWNGDYATLINEIKSSRLEIEEIERKYRLEKVRVEIKYDDRLEIEKFRRKYSLSEIRRIEKTYELEKEQVGQICTR